MGILTLYWILDQKKKHKRGAKHKKKEKNAGKRHPHSIFRSYPGDPDERIFFFVYYQTLLSFHSRLGLSAGERKSVADAKKKRKKEFVR